VLDATLLLLVFQFEPLALENAYLSRIFSQDFPGPGTFKEKSRTFH